MPWELKNDRPIWLQLAETLSRQIVSGQYPTGLRIPSVRDLAAEAGVNPNTMQRALAYMEESGLVTAQRNAGRYVTQDANLIDEMRKNLAMAELELFCGKMSQLGYSVTETAALLKEKGDTYE